MILCWTVPWTSVCSTKLRRWLIVRWQKAFSFAQDAAEPVQRIKKICAKLKRKYRATYEELLTAWLLIHPARILPVIGTTRL